MPFGKWADFESCVVDIMKQNPDYDEETAKATCGKLKTQLEGKIFWQGTVNLVEGNKVTGQALHPIKTYHQNEWPQVRVYLEEELKKSAETLSGKPFGIDHIFVLSEPNRITRAWWENDAINYEGDVDDKVAEMIREGEIKGVSVEYNWDLLQNLNGFAPRGLEFTSLHFLKNLEPGDPSAYVKLAEALITKLKEAKHSSPTATGQPGQPGSSQTIAVKSLNEEELKKFVESEVRNQIKAIFKETEWTTEYVNDLPDSAFAVIEPGGTKDEQGKTVPRTLRHLEHHNHQGELDLSHLRNALARLNQIEPASLRPEAKKHLCAHAKDSEIVSEFCGEEPPQRQEGKNGSCAVKPTLSEALITPTTQQPALAIPVEKLEAIMPPLQAERSMSWGAQRLVQDLKRLILEARRGNIEQKK